MKSNIFKFNLDMKKNYKETGITVVQLDNKATIFTVNLKNGELDYNLDTGDTVEVAFLKPDETFILMDAVASENSVNIELTSQILAVAGKAYCEIRIKKDDKILTSTQFDFFIRENIINNKRIESTTEYKALDKLITKANDVIIQLEHATNALTNVDALTAELEQIKQQIITAKEDIATSINNANTKKTELDAEITKATTALNNLNNALQNWETKKTEITELNNLVTTATELKTALTNLNASITESKNIKSSLDTAVDNATTAKTNLDSSVTTANTTKTNLDTSNTNAKATNTTLNTTNDTAKNTNTDLTNTNNNAKTTKSGLDTSVTNANTAKTNLETKITESTTAKTNLDKSITNANTAKTNLDSSTSTANTSKSNLDASITSANNAKTSLAEKEAEAKITEQSLLEIIASGDLSQYVTDPKLATELEKYALKTAIKTKLSELTQDSNNRTVTDAEKTKWNNPPTGIPSGGSTGQVLKKTADGVAWGTDNDTEYTHPSSHGADMITESTTKRFVSDAEKTTWNNKVDKVTGKGLSDNNYSQAHYDKVEAIPTNPNYTDTLYTAGTNVTITGTTISSKDTITTINGKTGAITKADIVALGIPSQDTNTTYGVATTSSNGLMSTTHVSKLDGIETGAQKNTVTSVSGKTGAVTISKSDVGLGSVNNVAISQAQVTKINELNYTRSMTQEQYDGLSQPEKDRADVWYGIYEE